MTLFNIASRVYNELGSGHSEYIYQRAMEIELRSRNITYECEKRVLVTYSDINNKVYNLGEERIDLYLLDHNIIIELKAIITPPREGEIAQIKKYYRELKKIGITPTYGIIINFPQCGAKESKNDIDFIEIKF